MSTVVTAGTSKHYLMVEQQLKPILAYMKAHIVPTYVFIEEKDFLRKEIINDDVLFRLQRLVEDTVMVADAFAEIRAKKRCGVWLLEVKVFLIDFNIKQRCMRKIHMQRCFILIVCPRKPPCMTVRLSHCANCCYFCLMNKVLMQLVIKQIIITMIKWSFLAYFL